MRLDPILSILWLLLLGIGIVAIYTASTTRIGEETITRDFWVRQIVWSMIAIVMITILMKIPYKILEILFAPAYTLSVLLLLIVLFLPAVKGSHRWIYIGGFSLQPSEIAKLTTILFAAKLMSRHNLTEWQILLRGILVFAPVIGLILIEPDLGTTLVFLAVLIVMLPAAGFPPLYLLMLISPLFAVVTAFSIPVFIAFMVLFIIVLIRSRLTIPAILFVGVINLFVFLITPVIWTHLRPYQQGRILTFLDPTRDPLGAGYQIIQARIAIGSGGVYGKGFLEGTQKNLNFLPERHTDFIFSVIGEEFGLTGTLVVVLLFMLMIMRLLSMTGRFVLREQRIAALGITTYLVFQIFVNIGMNLGMMPTTGLPLPFISYGGSSLLINSLAVGMALKFWVEKDSMNWEQQGTVL